ncbi:MAG: hypothetical protein ICV64_11910 [Thermoleophilia bacterium]|nr:hypothetical protein [Thermoleophilia bacterium]
MRAAGVIGASVLALLLAAPPAAAKFRVSLALSPQRPLAGSPVTLTLRADVDLPPEHALRLVAVAPQVSKLDVLRAVGHDRAIPARLGFEVPLTRTSRRAWAGAATFPRRGRWLLVVPNFGPRGYAIPQPLVRTVAVR